MTTQRRLRTLVCAIGLFAAACGETTSDTPPDAGPGGDSGARPDATITGKDPDQAEVVLVDRFSSTAGKLMVRTAQNGLPASNAPIDFDEPPFITMGLGPRGERVEYYNFDVQPVQPAPIYVFFHAGASTPVPQQLNVVDAIPGEAGYNDFWQVHRVTVPTDYVANSAVSKDDIVARGFRVEPLSMVVNCPIVPSGSTASKRAFGGSTALHRGWYRGKVVRYFTFEERALSGSPVPVSPIYVMFNINPDRPNGGPPSGFRTEMGTSQTHNVVATLPADDGYSPLWLVSVVHNAAFDAVGDLESARTSTVLAMGVMTVNCPIVSIEEPSVPVQSQALESFVRGFRYRAFKAEPAVHVSAGPHGNVRTFANATLRATFASGPHGAGAAAIKEIYTGNALSGWAVWVKIDNDSDQGRGIYWWELLNDNIVVAGRGVAGCSGCHMSGRDFALSPSF